MFFCLAAQYKAVWPRLDGRLTNLEYSGILNNDRNSSKSPSHAAFVSSSTRCLSSSVSTRGANALPIEKELRSSNNGKITMSDNFLLSKRRIGT